ncbi:MAG TPA: LytTR family DNA-binding domain-containing protein [Bacteroidales bacterium]
METFSNPSTLPLPMDTNDCVRYVDFSKIILIDSESRKTHVYVKDEEPILSSINITDLEAMLPPEFFFRCHRCQIIGLRHLKKFEKKTRVLTLADNYSAIVAEDLVKNFLDRTNPRRKKKK